MDEKQKSDKKPQSEQVTGVANGSQFTQQPAAKEQIKSLSNNKKQTLYRIGWWTRLVGLIGTIVALVYVIFAGPFAFLALFVVWYWAIPAFLLLAIGHYLASNNKDSSLKANDLSSSGGFKSKISPKRIVVAVIIIILLIPIGTTGHFFISCSLLDQKANKKEKELNSLTILDGQTTQSEGTKNGDCLTANETGIAARANFTTKGTLADTETQVSNNLAKAGFKRDHNYYEALQKTTYPGDPPEKEYTIILLRYEKDNERIFVHYNLDKLYRCPTGFECKTTGAPKNVYDVRGYGDFQTESLRVKLTSKDSTYPY